MNLILQIVLGILIPIYLFKLVLSSSFRNFVDWIFKAFFVGSYVFFLFFIAAWPFGLGYFFRYFLLIAFLICLVKSCYNKKKENLDLWKVRKILSYLFVLIPACFFLWVISRTFSSPHDQSIVLDFPLKDGRYYIVQGGEDITINHHYSIPAQKYALDIVKINQFGFRAKKWIPKKLTDYYIFDSPLYSPMDGTIVEAVDLFNDLIPPETDPDHPGGNYIVIKSKDSNLLIVLAHLKSKSVLVSKGMQVSQGQELARVGNSGNTSEPHLHIHSLLEKTGDSFFNGQGIPMIFDDRFLSRNHVLVKP